VPVFSWWRWTAPGVSFWSIPPSNPATALEVGQERPVRDHRHRFGGAGIHGFFWYSATSRIISLTRGGERRVPTMAVCVANALSPMRLLSPSPLQNLNGTLTGSATTPGVYRRRLRAVASGRVAGWGRADGATATGRASVGYALAPILTCGAPLVRDIAHESSRYWLRRPDRLRAGRLLR